MLVNLLAFTFQLARLFLNISSGTQVMRLSKFFILFIFLTPHVKAFNKFEHFSDSTRNTVSEDSTGMDNSEVKDVSDILNDIFGKNKERKPRMENSGSMLILPNISYNPSNGFLYGLGGNFAFYLGPKETTRVSYVKLAANYTTKNQFIAYIKSSLFAEDEKFYFSGDWRYYIFSAETYGLGTNAPVDFDIDPSWGFQGVGLDEMGGYPMLYNYVILHEIANYNILPNFYLGLGYQLDYYWQIVDQNLRLDTIPTQITPHYSYAIFNEFNPERYTLSGVSLNAMYDSRDNQISAYKGIFARLNYRMNPTFFGSSKNSTELWAEFRSYVGLSKKTPRHLVAFWLFGNFVVSGTQPYFTLMGLGEDEQARSGRGYTLGRFRGQDYIYGEVEYRFPILPRRQTLGGVIFINATTASNRLLEVGLFDYIQPAVGFGFRLLTNKYTRLNLCLDLAFGFQSKGAYLSGSETF